MSFGFGSCDLFTLPLALQLKLCQLPLGDVGPDNQQAVRAAVVVPSDGRPKLEVLCPIRGLPDSVTALIENALHARLKFGVCLLSRHLTEVPANDVFGAATIVPGVRAVHEHVTFALIKLRNEDRNAVGYECQTCFSPLARPRARAHAEA